MPTLVDDLAAMTRVAPRSTPDGVACACSMHHTTPRTWVKLGSKQSLPILWTRLLCLKEDPVLSLARLPDIRCAYLAANPSVGHCTAHMAAWVNGSNQMVPGIPSLCMFDSSRLGCAPRIDRAVRQGAFWSATRGVRYTLHHS